MPTLTHRLAGGETILIDGAVGTELERAGVPMVQGAWCGDAARTHAPQLRNVHLAHIRAGAELIIANTYASSRHLLEFGDLGEHFEQINRSAVEIALEARAESGNDNVVVAGSMSTSQQGGPFPPIEAARSNFADQAKIIADAGADMIVLEMMRDIDQTDACLSGALATGLPVWLGWSCIIDAARGPSEPMLFNGDVTLRDGMASIDGRGVELVAIMHTEVVDIDPCLDVLDEVWEGPVGIYAHSGEFVHPNWIFNDVISIDDYTHAVQGWHERGVQVLGGCCGISPDHIAALNL